MTTTIEIKLEDGHHTLPAGSTVADLVEALQLPPRAVSVAVDGSHVPRAQWLSHPLANGQQVLFFKPIVGG
jgi:thiamine biosynthesis protein ThiS